VVEKNMKWLTFSISFPYFSGSMRKSGGVLFAIPFLLPLHLAAQSGSSVVQTVTVDVKPIVAISVSGNPGALQIVGIQGDEQSSSVSDRSTRYSMVTNLDDMKIVASISDPMPEGTRLMIDLESTQGLSNGAVDISQARAPVNVVTGIGRGGDLNRTITYTFAASETVNDLSAESRVITLTLTE
jgi:hypothetical protein